MRANRSGSAPLYIPDELQRAYGAQARWQVATSVAARDRNRPPSPLRSVPAAHTERLVLFAAWTGLGIWGGLVALWVWMALHDPMLWAPIAMSGAVVLVLAAVALRCLFRVRAARRPQR